MNFIGKLLPGEGYQVCVIEEAPMNYSYSLSHLYQPIAGIEAVALYRTLLDETVFPTETPRTHHHLMNYLNMPLDKIYEARLKLEALGLLKTFESTNDSVRIFHYEILPPMSPSAFFDEPVLAGMLLQELGDQKLRDLEALVMPKRHHTEEDTDVTASFDEVFGQARSGYKQEHHVEKLEKGPNTDAAAAKVDFNWLAQSLKKQMLPFSKILSEENRRIISQMAVYYGLHTIELENSLVWALTDENELDRKEFDAACRVIFNDRDRQEPVRSMEQMKQEAVQEPVKTEGRKGTLLYKFETMSPREILEDMSNGNNASEQDLKMISDIMTAQGLSLPVMNVLVHYVLLKNDMRLSKPYLESIAGHWSRAKLSTAKEAMEYAKKGQQEQKSGSKRGYAKNVKKEIVPDWIKKNKPAESTSISKKNNEQQDQAEIADVLSRLIQKN